jgi:2-C-methyl-D-erythritol 2,4-cyclodiphosphate synthase
MVGFGYDVHRLREGEELVLGGVVVPAPFGTVAHSDGDVLVHAICDALLGGAGLGDIGEHFPDTSDEFRGISSLVLLKRVVDILHKDGIKIINIDSTLVLEAPKLKDYKQQMRENIAEICHLGIRCVSIKATTSEKLGFVGAGEGVQAYAVCQLEMM